MTHQRIAMLDGARGLAILGILLLNITGFGLPKAAFLNPAYLGTPPLSDLLTWGGLEVLARSKFLAMLTLLFGAGLQRQLGQGAHWMQNRLGWLLLFGLIHTLLFWDGDILVAYALVGLLCWRLIRDADSAWALCRTGLFLYLTGLLLLLLWGLLVDPEKLAFWTPLPQALEWETAWKLQGGLLAWENRLHLLLSTLQALSTQYGWQLAGMMLWGAALLRTGWLAGRYSVTHYRQVAWTLIPAAGLLQLAVVYLQWQSDWDFRWSGFLLQIPHELAALMQAMGILALLYGYWAALARWRVGYGLQQIGRMAFSNYLLQTLICTTLFYHLGGYRQFSRLELLGLVPIIWLVNLLFSLWWLRHFTQGPLEWLWRWLIRWSLGRQGG